MQHITMQELRDNARAWYERGRLTAQLPPKEAICVYKKIANDGEEYRCGIGASLNAESLKAVLETPYLEDDGTLYDGKDGRPFRDHNEKSIGGCSFRKQLGDKITFEDFEEARSFQNAHDAWANTARSGYTSEITRHHNAFRHAIGLPPLAKDAGEGAPVTA